MSIQKNRKYSNKNLSERPIGVFDSGIGGLTVVSQVIRQ
ncbi:MAG: glutamate racemase, partial [Candidatus Zixiibacteriota bacterium]